MKKLMILICMMLVFSLVNTQPVNAISDSEFESNDAHYRQLCSTKITKDSQQTCRDYQRYINRKLAKLANDLKTTETSLESIKGNLQETLEKSRDKQKEIDKAESDIKNLEKQIKVVQNNIKELGENIVKQEQEIKEIDRQIKERLVKRQSDLHVNTIVEFVFGAASYTEFQRNAETVNRINQQDKDLMLEYEAVLSKLTDDKAEVERQNTLLQDSLNNVNELKKGLEVAKAGLEQLITTYRQQESEMIAKQMAIQNTKSQQSSNLSTVKSGLATYQREVEEARRRAEAERRKPVVTTPDNVLKQSGSGWIYPVNGSFKVTAGAWYYPGSFRGSSFGNVHYGVDLAGDMGTPLVATGPGIVIKAHSSCSAWGYLGNPCGSYGGNHVQILYSMNGKLYSLLYSHLQRVYVRQGQVVTKGMTIGTLGSSGSSTGPHLHHEIIYVSNLSLENYMNTWNGTTTFTPNGQWMTMPWTCDNRGNVPPCRINPQTWYGFKVGRYY